MKLVPAINIDTCVDGCDSEPTCFYWIGEPDSGILVACCEEHTNRVGLCSWYATIKELSYEEAVILSVLKA